MNEISFDFNLGNLLDQPKIQKPWGYEIIWAKTDVYVSKILNIYHGHRLSRQEHLKKTETFLVKSGTLRLEIGSSDKFVSHILSEGQFYHCPPRTIHRMIGESDVVVIEIATALDKDDLGEDIIRYEDDYGRAE